MTSPRTLRTGVAALAGFALIAVLPGLPAAAQPVHSLANDFSISVDVASETIDAGQSVKVNVQTQVTEGSAQSVNLSASGLPAGATATFAPASIQTGDWATMRITTTAGTPDGTTQVTITGDGADIDHTVQFTLIVGDGGGDPPGGCDGTAAWAAQTAYVPGNVVSHNGHKWDSTWYSTGAEPGAPSSWAVWKDAGAC